MRIKQELYDEIRRVFRYGASEKGGVLGIRDGEIISCHLDRKGGRGIDFYKPDPQFLRENVGAIQQNGSGFSFIHSHPVDWPLSYSDISYVREFLKLNHRTTGHTALLRGEELEIYQIGPDEAVTQNRLEVI